MGYKLDYRNSPNFTPASQTRQYYGRDRTFEKGAGHWWGDPYAGYSHDGIIATAMNPARQMSPFAIISAGRATIMGDIRNAFWCTSNANPFTIAIETDPRIYLRGNAEQIALSDAIAATWVEFVADHVLPFVKFDMQWLPHKTWAPTGCNPINWESLRQRAWSLYQSRINPPAPVAAEWKKNLKAIAPVTMYAIDDETPLRNLNKVTEVVKGHAKGTPFEITAETRVNGYRYLLTRWAVEHDTGQGFDEYELQATDPTVPPPQPEWLQNMVDVDDVKLMVLPAQTAVVNLATGKDITQLGQGTWVDIAKKTTVGGKVYLISQYAAEHGLPNGILLETLGVPAPTPEPEPEKPEWLKNWQDIADVTMYTRSDAQIIRLLDGKTMGTIPRGTAVEIASATEWHGEKYLISKYATAGLHPHGIALVDLDMKPVEPEPEPVPPAKPTDELIKETNEIVKEVRGLVQWLVEAVKKILSKLNIGN